MAAMAPVTSRPLPVAACKRPFNTPDAEVTVHALDGKL